MRVDDYILLFDIVEKGIRIGERDREELSRGNE